ncbi:MAG: hypothetical protein OXF74_05210 [Rhodobacteraceae bacterium]|nr:hypothetical protein [Paracoccaceae bacterium]
MTDGGIKIGMTPPHPGTIIRIEVLEELGLSITSAARILGVRRVPQIWPPDSAAENTRFWIPPAGIAA